MRGAIFDTVRAELGPRAQAPDLPGHGARAGEPAGLAACVADLDARLRASGRRDTLLVGWSMGAAIAWSYIAAHGTDRLAGLVTVDMSPKPANSESWNMGLRGQTPHWRARTTAEIHSDWPTAAAKIATTMFAEHAGAPDFDWRQALDQVLSNRPEVMGQYWDEMMELDLREATGRVDIPWLIMYGAKSHVYPADTARWLAQAGARAETHCFDQSGHSPHLEEPEAFVDALRAFESGL